MKNLNGRPMVIRADASLAIGTGHVMRCLALGQAWKDAGGRVCFVTHCRSEGLTRRLRAEQFDVHELGNPYPDPSDWPSTREIIGQHPNAWVVLDGYHFDESYQERVKELGNHLLVIDDMAHLGRYHADILLNQNLNAGQLPYSCEPCTVLLLGTPYVLLRREFLSWGSWRREIPQVAKRVLVTLGGSDPHNHTLRVIEALQSLDVAELEAAVVLGAGNPYAEAVHQAVGNGPFPMRLLRDVEDMPGLMAASDVAVSAAGSTIWELMFMGVPSVLVVVADNQSRTAAGLGEWAVGLLDARQGLDCSSLHRALDTLMRDAGLRRQVSASGRRNVDGLGPGRVIECMAALESTGSRSPGGGCR